MAGSINVNWTGGNIRSGQTAYATGTGFWLGNDGGTPKFSIGGLTNYLRWNGSSLAIGGDIYATTVQVVGETLSYSVPASSEYEFVSSLYVSADDRNLVIGVRSRVGLVTYRAVSYKPHVGAPPVGDNWNSRVEYWAYDGDDSSGGPAAPVAQSYKTVIRVRNNHSAAQTVYVSVKPID